MGTALTGDDNEEGTVMGKGETGKSHVEKYAKPERIRYMLPDGDPDGITVISQLDIKLASAFADLKITNESHGIILNQVLFRFLEQCSAAADVFPETKVHPDHNFHDLVITLQLRAYNPNQETKIDEKVKALLIDVAAYAKHVVDNNRAASVGQFPPAPISFGR